MRSLRNSDCGLVHVLGKFAVLAHQVCSFYIIRPCSSSLQRLKPTANFQRRESAASNRARRATLNFFLRFFFFLLSFLFHRKAAPPGDLVAPKASSRARGRRLGQVCWERASGTQPALQTPYSPSLHLPERSPIF